MLLYTTHFLWVCKLPKNLSFPLFVKFVFVNPLKILKFLKQQQQSQINWIFVHPASTLNNKKWKNKIKIKLTTWKCSVSGDLLDFQLWGWAKYFNLFYSMKAWSHFIHIANEIIRILSLCSENYVFIFIWTKNQLIICWFLNTAEAKALVLCCIKRNMDVNCLETWQPVNFMQHLKIVRIVISGLQNSKNFSVTQIHTSKS